MREARTLRRSSDSPDDVAKLRTFGAAFRIGLRLRVLERVGPVLAALEGVALSLVVFARFFDAALAMVQPS